MTRRSTTGRSALLRLLGVAALAVLLAGCIKFDTDLTVSSDDTVSGEMILGFDQSLLEMTGGSLDDVLGSGMEPIPDDIEGVTAEDWEDDTFVGQRFVLDAVPLDEFNADSAEGALQIERDGDVFRLSANMDMTGTEDLAGGEEFGLDPEALMGNAELEVRVTFPGEILETNGDVSGTTVTWELGLTGTNEMTAVAEAEPSGGSSLLWIVLAVVLLVVVGAVLFVLLRRRDEPAPATATAAGGTTFGTPAPGAPPVPGTSPEPSQPPPPAAPDATAWPETESGDTDAPGDASASDDSPGGGPSVADSPGPGLPPDTGPASSSADTPSTPPAPESSDTAELPEDDDTNPLGPQPPPSS